MPDLSHKASHTTNREEPAVSSRRANVAACCALISGTTSAAIFNPWDRALYLSVLHERPFLSPANFDKPFQGFGQAIAHRIISGGCWFMLEDMFTAPCQTLLPHNPLAASALTGVCAGAVNGAILNPVALTKYRLWGKETPVVQEILNTVRYGGVRYLFVGGLVTVLRDSLFGVVYTASKWLALDFCHRHDIGQKQTGQVKPHEFACKMLAGGLATTACSPLNYIRNIKYSHHCLHTSPKGMTEIWEDLCTNFRCRVQTQGWRPGLGWLQMRLTTGWGIARVAVGMAVGDLVYSQSKRLFP
eukprot:EG_transcript_15590